MQQQQKAIFFRKHSSELRSREHYFISTGLQGLSLQVWSSFRRWWKIFFFLLFFISYTVDECTRVEHLRKGEGTWVCFLPKLLSRGAFGFRQQGVGTLFCVLFQFYLKVFLEYPFPLSSPCSCVHVPNHPDDLWSYDIDQIVYSPIVIFITESFLNTVGAA